MRPLIILRKWLTAITLLVTLVSFSGFGNAVKHSSQPQIELITQRTTEDKASVLYSDTRFGTYLNVSFNQYVVFTFRSLLSYHKFNFKITFKIQKDMVLEFMDVNATLDHNRIAHVPAKDVQDVLTE